MTRNRARNIATLVVALIIISVGLPLALGRSAELRRAAAALLWEASANPGLTAIIVAIGLGILIGIPLSVSISRHACFGLNDDERGLTK